MLKKRFLNMNAASAVLAEYEAFDNYSITGKEIKSLDLLYHALGQQ
jgi:hypothetical protein